MDLRVTVLLTELLTFSHCMSELIPNSTMSAPSFSSKDRLRGFGFSK
jgi:hypothetical protein